MIHDFSPTFDQEKKNFLLAEKNLPFSDYIARCRAHIEDRRVDLTDNAARAKLIIDANSPYELYPKHPIHSNPKLKYGALLMHGLFDGPFSLRDIGVGLQENGILCRSILLPGHGTQPKDLLHVSSHAWIETMRYGIESLRQEVEQVFLVGYSTGAALAILQALQDTQIAGIILLSPAVKIKAPVDMLLGWNYLIKLMRRRKQWIYREDEDDYVKYHSLPLHPVTEVSNLTIEISKLRQKHKLHCPIFMSISTDDETISSRMALDFFTHYQNENSQLVLYSSNKKNYSDSRIIVRPTYYPELKIKNFSHVSVPFSPHNPHYGQHGDYIHASYPHMRDCIYGAYNHIEEKGFDFLYELGLIKHRHRELTYNPDFDFMTEKLLQFVLRN